MLTVVCICEKHCICNPLESGWVFYGPENGYNFLSPSFKVSQTKSTGNYLNPFHQRQYILSRTGKIEKRKVSEDKGNRHVMYI